MATSNIYLKFISSLKDGASFATKKMLGGIVTSAKFAANRVAAVGGAFAGMGRSALSQAANVKAVFDMMMGAARSFAGAVAGLVRRAGPRIGRREDGKGLPHGVQERGVGTRVPIACDEEGLAKGPRETGCQSMMFCRP